MTHNINHPTLIAVKQNRKITYLSSIVCDKSYISKPINGSLGNGIKKIKGIDVDDFLNHKSNDDLLIQEYLHDCRVDVARHFRYVTLYDGNSFVMKEFMATDPNQITSNLHTGGVNNHLHAKTIPLNKQKIINEICDQLKTLHKNVLPMVFSIGWDIMFNCENNVSQAYCLEGNICQGI